MGSLVDGGGYVGEQFVEVFSIAEWNSSSRCEEGGYVGRKFTFKGFRGRGRDRRDCRKASNREVVPVLRELRYLPYLCTDTRQLPMIQSLGRRRGWVGVGLTRLNTRALEHWSTRALEHGLRLFR